MLEPDEPEGSRAALELAEGSNASAQEIEPTAAPSQSALPPNDDTGPRSSIPELALIQQYIEALKAADIHNGDLSADAVHRPQNPPTTRVMLDESKDRGLLLSLRQYLAHAEGPENGYAKSIKVCHASGFLNPNKPSDKLLCNSLDHTIRF